MHVNFITSPKVKKIKLRHIHTFQSEGLFNGQSNVSQNDMKKWPFKVINQNSKPKIQVNFKGKDEIFHPEQISSMILLKMKEIAALHLNQEIKQSVIFALIANFLLN